MDTSDIRQSGHPHHVRDVTTSLQCCIVATLKRDSCDHRSDSATCFRTTGFRWVYCKNVNGEDGMEHKSHALDQVRAQITWLFDDCGITVCHLDRWIKVQRVWKQTI